VGADEPTRDDPTEASLDLDYESATLYNRARRVPDITSQLRIIAGGHDWSSWRPLFREGLLERGRRLPNDSHEGKAEAERVVLVLAPLP